MATATAIATQLVGILAEEVLARRDRTYGWYAKAVGRDPAKGAIAIGPAMHAIGAVCVIRQMPIAPLHYVTVASGERKQVFAESPLEISSVLPHYDLLYVVARDYQYKVEEFANLSKRVSEVFSKWEEGNRLSPHELWTRAIIDRPKGNSQTYWERALLRYQEIKAELLVARSRP